MKTKAIGICDSGLGGYSFYHALSNAFPTARFVLIADQKNAPFGDKNQDELLSIGLALVNKFKAMDITTVLFGCNTLSATVLKECQQQHKDMRLLSVIDLTVQQISEKAKRILVLATTATTQRLAYSKAISQMNKNAWIHELAAPKLVPLIEGLADDEDIDLELEQLLYKKGKVDTIVLGCTHYSLISDNFKKVTKATLVDGLQGAISLFEDEELPQGESEVYTTLDADRLKHQIKTLFGDEVEVREIEL